MQLIPGEYEYDSYNNYYHNATEFGDGLLPIKQGSKVRVRIVGTKVDATEIVSSTACTYVLQHLSHYNAGPARQSPHGDLQITGMWQAACKCENADRTHCPCIIT